MYSNSIYFGLKVVPIYYIGTLGQGLVHGPSGLKNPLTNSEAPEPPSDASGHATKPPGSTRDGRGRGRKGRPKP